MKAVFGKVLFAAAGLYVTMAGAVLAACDGDRVTAKGDWGLAHFQVDVADDPEERAQGLMFVEEMPIMSGMLFIYPNPQHATFWMKNTLIPLDMFFADANGVILAIHENAVPQDTTTIDGGAGVSAVLELNGGMASRLGIAVGDTLHHPAFVDAAATSCAQ